MTANLTQNMATNLTQNASVTARLSAATHENGIIRRPKTEDGISCEYRPTKAIRRRPSVCQSKRLQRGCVLAWQHRQHPFERPSLRWNAGRYAFIVAGLNTAQGIYMTIRCCIKSKGLTMQQSDTLGRQECSISEDPDHERLSCRYICGRLHRRAKVVLGQCHILLGQGTCASTYYPRMPQSILIDPHCHFQSTHPLVLSSMRLFDHTLASSFVVTQRVASFLIAILDLDSIHSRTMERQTFMTLPNPSDLAEAPLFVRARLRQYLRPARCIGIGMGYKRLRPSTGWSHRSPLECSACQSQLY